MSNFQNIGRQRNRKGFLINFKSIELYITYLERGKSLRIRKLKFGVTS